jgi:uncharacterized membrane-anchored protein YhcB (DUF1043 family)
MPRPFAIIAAVVGLVIGAVLTPITFRNQFQQMDTVRNLAIISLIGGRLYLLMWRHHIS